MKRDGTGGWGVGGDIIKMTSCVREREPVDCYRVGCEIHHVVVKGLGL